MTTNHKPQAALPWVRDEQCFDSKDYAVGRARTWVDAAYIVHCSNAYPRLVEALHASAERLNTNAIDADFAVEANRASTLLRELGEDK